MRVIGLTGSIGMGKSSLAQVLRHRYHVPVFEADKIVHHLLSHETEVIEAVRDAFPRLIRSRDEIGRSSAPIDRQHLAKLVFSDERALYKLEALLHPYIKRACHRFLAQMQRRRARIVVIEAPLLLESGIFAECDQLWVVSAPYFLQKHRVRMRLGMNEDNFAAILARQWSDNRKRRLADYVIPTGLGWSTTSQMLARALKSATSIGSPNAKRENAACYQKATRTHHMGRI